jgi:hypothetical protein
MSSESKRKHVFVSHHHKDDAGVDKLTKLLAGRGYDIRNSSIRAKASNQARLDRGLVSDETIRRLLRRKISWAGKVIVLIGKETHKRPWVNWEIDQAQKQGKAIIGIFEHGGTNADVPSNLKKYASELVAWNPDSIIAALDGTDAPFQEPDGSPSPPPSGTPRSVC